MKHLDKNKGSESKGAKDGFLKLIMTIKKLILKSGSKLKHILSFKSRKTIFQQFKKFKYVVKGIQTNVKKKSYLERLV